MSHFPSPVWAEGAGDRDRGGQRRNRDEVMTRLSIDRVWREQNKGVS